MADLTKKEKIVWREANKLMPKFLSFFKWVLIIAFGFSLSSYLSAVLPGRNSSDYLENDSLSFSYEDNDSCNVVGLSLRGSIVTYIPDHAEGDSFFDYDVTASEDITWYINNANENEQIKAIVIEVDSGGGSPVAGEEIANAIKNSQKEVVSYIRDVGASAAYWSISSADKIFASKNSDIGGIGVTASYLSNVDRNEKEGYKYEQLISGKFKDSGSSDKVLTKEEKELFMRDINIMYQNFVQEISINRNIPIDKVKSFADGSTVLGERARELGLIDEIGGLTEVEAYLEGAIGTKPNICW